MVQSVHNPASPLTVRDIHKSFAGIHVLNGVSFSVEPGTVTALVGSNGAGKSTLINVMAGVFPADRGEVYVNGRHVTAQAMHERVAAGFMRTFQHPRVFRSFTVARCIEFAHAATQEETLWYSLGQALGLRARTRQRPELDMAIPALEPILARQDAQAGDLSYGEQKLLMLAQALATDSSVLFFDELCAGLEPAMVDEVRACIRQLAQAQRTIVFVEHNLALVKSLADRVIFLHQGEIFRDGATDDVLQDDEVIKLYLGQ